MMQITQQHRAAAYLARRILRADPQGATYKRLIRAADPFTRRLMEVLPRYSEHYCIAKAEQLAIVHALSQAQGEAHP